VEGKDDRESGGLFVALASGMKVDLELSGMTVVEEHVPDLTTRPSSNRSCSNWSSSDGARVPTEADQG